MMWDLKRWWIKFVGAECPKCHADLRRVYTCGICGRKLAE